MKTSPHRIAKILGTLAFGGFLMNPSQLSAQEPGNRETQAGPPPQDRIRHLREDAEHLKAAGFEKQSAQAVAEIARIEAANRPKQDQCCCDEGSQANAALQKELNKLRREMDELRAQVRRLSAAPPPKHTPKHTPQSPERPDPRGDRGPENR